MKKILTLLVSSLLILTSCSTTTSTTSTAFGGALFGGMIGSAVGGISGGPRGSSIGTLIGGAAGAMAGVAVDNALQKKAQTYYGDADVNKDSYNDNRRASGMRNMNVRESYDPVYNDIVDLRMPKAHVESTDSAILFPNTQYPIYIENTHFLNSTATPHIAQNEMVSIQFEIRNISETTITNVVPVVIETTGNKRLQISPATLIEQIPGGSALRYSTFVKAQDNLKSGTAHFDIYITANGAMVSQKVSFDVPLN